MKTAELHAELQDLQETLPFALRNHRKACANLEDQITRTASVYGHAVQWPASSHAAIREKSDAAEAAEARVIEISRLIEEYREELSTRG